jgi:hypothetical protein
MLECKITNTPHRRQTIYPHIYINIFLQKMNTYTNSVDLFELYGEQIYQLNVLPNTILCIEKIGNTLIRIFFIAEDTANEVPIPNTFYIYDNKNNSIVNPIPETNSFTLCSSYIYTLSIAQTIIIEISDKRIWEMISK